MPDNINVANTQDYDDSTNFDASSGDKSVADIDCTLYEQDIDRTQSPLDSEKIASRKRYFARLRNDWALPHINDQIHANACRTQPSPKIDMEIALVGSDRLALALGDVVRVMRLDPNEWRAQLENSHCAFVLVEADWLQPSDPWRSRLIGSEAEKFLPNFVRVCRELDIPTAFWFNQDQEHISVFRCALEPFDFVFANSLCIDSVQKYRTDAVPLASFVDVGCFNPYKQREGNWRGLKSLLPILMGRAFQYTQLRGTGDLSDRIASLFDQQFWLYEDRYLVRNNNQRLNPVERSRLLGCFHGESRASLLKTAVAEIFPKELYSTHSPQSERHFYECLATKTIPIFSDPAWSERLPDEIGKAFLTDDFRKLVTSFAAHPIETAINAHLGWRNIMTHNTYYEFIEAICMAMKIPVSYSTPKEARISFIMPTIRPALIPMAIKFYQAQNYNNRELIIVLNSEVADRSSLERMKGDDDSIHILYSPSDMPVGCAVNMGVASMSGDYWAKMDDDDYYSPNYLSDINLYRKFLDFDIAGKGALFNYLEEQDQTILRSTTLWDRETHNFAGGTLVVKNTPDNVHWPELVRGFADIEFLTSRLVEGAHIASLDPFGHVQIRRKDSRFHTWTRQASQMNSDYAVDGLNLESVFI